ncbi:FtsX-like permease family protein [Cellulomonas dongxiuzhuiae]|uniref:FtsX-like permease family protein n=1 Tax=Cellulomonas dongxiuzhuiae TaxID=2819979 RepID=A0ABX8GL90_9CELL|nr:FtsX-like permease family protein [Cellulomonas dongxiuzhuiae]MBO3096539.1 FtsX-like permease family protein [Cellulomonas dongxiuzhuiae]QWC16928.1 FtsX-like permease family protein [Cellulomonas dongxiuzhuiae]
MGWRSQVLLGRLRDQATVIATVAVVTFVATTLLGTFAFLLEVTGDDAVEAEIARVPDSAVTLEAVVRVNKKDAAAALAATDVALAATLGDLPSDRETWLTGRMWSLPLVAGTQFAPVAYPASTPLLPEQGELVAGAWPDRARDDGGRLLVNAPDVAAQRYGWTVGTVVPVRTLGGQTQDSWVVVGTHRLTGSSASWSRDLLKGAAHDSRYPVIGTGGRLTTDAWGPMVVAPDALLGVGTVDTVHVLTTPHLAGAPRGALTQTRDNLESTQAQLSAGLRDVGASGFVLTRLGETIDASWRELTVTRVGVVVVGLLLVVLATTVMLLAARLLGERRAAEGELVAARGASAAQLRSLAVLEAAVLAAVAAAVAPWVARVAFTRLADAGGLGDAGLGAPPGIPVSVWIACAAVATVLAVSLVVPAWHTAGSSSAAAHAGLVRAGADLALVVLAGVALWQLLDYGAPLTRGPAGVRLDPVLVVGPALVTLGAAVLALRAVAPLARGADVLARRSASLVVPLAAWQVSRRFTAATGTTLVVILAVSAATFSHAFLATWRTSQVDQVDLAVGTDVRVEGIRGERLTASADARAVLADAPAGTHLQPVVDRNASIGRPVGQGQESSGFDVRMLAVDTEHPEALRGRTDVPWSTLVGGLGTPEGEDAPVSTGPTGTPLPGDPQWLVVTMTAGSDPYTAGMLYPTLAVEDETGVRAWVSVPELPLDVPSTFALAVPRGLGPLRLVAASAVVTLSGATAMGADSPAARLGQVWFTLQDVRVLDRAVGLTSPDEALAAASAQGTPVALEAGGWQAGATSGGLERGATVGARVGPYPFVDDVPPGALVVDGKFDLAAMDGGNGRLVAHAWPAHGAVRALVTTAVAERASLSPGIHFWIRAGDAQVQAVVEDVVPYLPGVPRGPAVLVDRDALGRGSVEAAGTDPLVDSWWLAAPDGDAPALAAALARAADAEATVRTTERAAAVAGPLSAAIPAALSLVTAATLVLVLVGLGASAAAAIRSRRLELARLQALGAARPSLVRGLVGEHVALVLVGALAGLAIGYGLARVVTPVLTVSSDGRRPVPAPLVVWQDGLALVITGGLALAACAVVALLAVVLVRRASGALLRLGDDR